MENLELVSIIDRLSACSDRNRELAYGIKEKLNLIMPFNEQPQPDIDQKIEEPVCFVSKANLTIEHMQETNEIFQSLLDHLNKLT